MMMTFNKYIDDYHRAIRSGELIVNKDILMLIDYVERVLSQPNVIIRNDMIDVAVEKIHEYFPYKLFDWELYLLALIHCYYDDNTLVWNKFFIMMGRGAGKNGFISPLVWYLTTSFHGINEYNVDIVANSEEQAKTSFEEVYNVIDKSSKLKKAFKYTLEKIIFKKTYA